MTKKGIYIKGNVLKTLFVFWFFYSKEPRPNEIILIQLLHKLIRPILRKYSTRWFVIHLFKRLNWIDYHPGEIRDASCSRQSAPWIVSNGQQCGKRLWQNLYHILSSCQKMLWGRGHGGVCIIFCVPSQKMWVNWLPLGRGNGVCIILCVLAHCRNCSPLVLHHTSYLQVEAWVINPHWWGFIVWEKVN